MLKGLFVGLEASSEAGHVLCRGLRKHIDDFFVVLWIRIRMDPHSFGCLRSVLGLRIRIRIRNQEYGNLPKFTNKPGFLPFKKAFVPMRYIFWPSTGTVLLVRYIFHVKFRLKSLTRIWIRIRMDPRWFGSRDPNPHWDKKLDLDPTNANPHTGFLLEKNFLCHKETFARNRIGFGFKTAWIRIRIRIGFNKVYR